LVEAGGRRMGGVLVGLGEVDRVGVEELSGDRLRVTIRSRGPRPVCGECGGRVWSKGDQSVRLVDLPAFGRPVRLGVAHNAAGCAPDRRARWGRLAEQDLSVAPERALLTSRAGRWATAQVGRFGRTVSEVAEELGCDWHTVNREIVRWGDALLEADVSRFGQVEAVGVDETLFWRKGRWRKKQWCTSVVDVGGRQLSDIVPGRTADSAASWFRNQPTEWCEAIRWAVSGHVRPLPGRLRPGAAPRPFQVADPFHVVRLANRCVDLVRRRVQNETLDAPRTKRRSALSDQAVVDHGV
ncbi:MAG: transposase, partial [bacterium]|nr:transposase [bacterium]